MNTTTLDKMRQLKFYGMFRAFKISMESGKQESYTPDEIIAHLIEAEWEDRQNRSIEQKIKNARFRYKAAVEDLHYTLERNIDKNQIIITSQVPVSKWHEIIGEKTIADAILDRIVHDAHRIELKGESLRKKRENTKNFEIN